MNRSFGDFNQSLQQSAPQDENGRKLSVTCTEFRPLRRNTLIGFAKIRVAEMRLTIHDVAIHEKGDSQWAQLPAKPQINKDGVAIRDRPSGKIQYSALFEFEGRETRDAFSRAVINAVLEFDPAAFGSAG